MKEHDLPVRVKGLLPTPSGVGVFLASEGREKVLAIFVDHSVAAAITMFLHKLKKPRPLTHDLLGSMLSGLGARVQRVVINDLKDDTFFARVFLAQDSELGHQFVEVDSRPSDAIALALQQDAPIFVRAHVWEEAEDMAWALSKASPGPDADRDGEGPSPEP